MLHLLRHLPTKHLLKNRIFPRNRQQIQTFKLLSRKKTWGKDQILALSTWLLVGTGAFVLIGTTTSASLALLLANSLQFQGKNSNMFFISNLFLEYVAGKLGKLISKSSGWKVSLGSEIVPNWRDGRITLRDVSFELGDINQKDEEIPIYEEEVPVNENYTRFSVQVERLDVRISLRRWLEGRGWLEEVFIDGAKGTLDKRWIRAIEGWRWKARPGDFDLDSLQLRNVHLSIIQPRGFHPYSVTILSASVPRLRASWLFYDLLSAESAHGIFDGRSLFTLHTATGNDERRLKHFRMLGLNVRHLSQSSSDNALGWVTRGTVDIEGFYQLPCMTRDKNNNPRIGSFDFNPADTLKEKLLLPLLEKRSDDSESSINPLKYWYDSKIKPKLPDELVPITEKLVSLPELISERISQRKQQLICYCN